MSNEKPGAREVRPESQEGMKALDTKEQLQKEVNNYAKAVLTKEEITTAIESLKKLDQSKLTKVQRSELEYQGALLKRLDQIMTQLEKLIKANLALDYRKYITPEVRKEIDQKFKKMVDEAIPYEDYDNVGKPADRSKSSPEDIYQDW